MNEDLDKVIRYVYNEFGQEFGDIIVDLKHQLQAYKEKEDKLREYVSKIKSSGINSHFDAVVIQENILAILNDKVAE